MVECVCEPIKTEGETIHRPLCPKTQKSVQENFYNGDIYYYMPLYWLSVLIFGMLLLYTV